MPTRTLDDPAAACAPLRAADPALARAMDAVGPYAPTPRPLHSPFAGLLRAIAGQQLSMAAARTIHERVLDLFPGRLPTPGSLLALDPGALREAGLSRAKVRAVRDLAEKALDGTVPDPGELHDLSDEALIERLLVVRGVGPWTVQMLLLRLGRPDVLPTADLGIRKGVARIDGLEAAPTPREVARRGEVWAPFRSVASWYLWRVLEV
jgi:DNA-3-methyladenine glycosylase II